MRTDWRLVICLYLAGLLAAAQFATIALSLPRLAEIYPARPLPLTVSALSVAGILFGVTAGALVARLGARRVLLAALALGGALSLAKALLPPFGAFIALRLVEGLSHLAIVVAAPTLMAAVSAPRDKPVAMGLWGTFFGVGFAGVAAVSFLVPGVSGLLLVHGLALWIIALALLPLLPRGVARDESRGNWLERHRAVFGSPRRIAPALGFVWHTLTFLGLLTFLPRFVGSWASTVLPLVALIGTFGAGLLARRFRPRDILIAAFLLGICGALATAAVPPAARPAAAVLLFVILGLVPGASFANVPALNPDPADQARANGAIAQLGNVGTFATTPVFALAAGHGLQTVVLTAAGLSAAGCLVVWLIHRKIAHTP